MGGIHGKYLREQGRSETKNGTQRKVWNQDEIYPDTDVESDKESGHKITLCVGDIHGNLVKLVRLWKNLERHLGSRIFQHCSIIFLGDYCDRGPETSGVLEFLSTLGIRYPNQEHTFLAGNHDLGMAAFLGELPPAPLGFRMSDTWASNNRKKQEGWWWGPGVEDMHLQGRRWGGLIYEKGNSIFDSRSTFTSYKAPHGNREKLLAAVPEHHKQFLRDMKWVHEAPGPPFSGYAGIIAVHAGLEADRPVIEQLDMLRRRDVTQARWENVSGRNRVWNAPEEAKRHNMLVISGHHGVLDVQSEHRLVVDEGGGWADMPLTAVILPSRTVVRDTDAKLYRRKKSKKDHRK